MKNKNSLTVELQKIIKKSLIRSKSNLKKLVKIKKSINSILDISIQEEQHEILKLQESLKRLG